MDAVPVRSRAGKGGQASQACESVAELSGVELGLLWHGWLLGHWLIPVLQVGGAGLWIGGEGGTTRREGTQGSLPRWGTYW